MALSGESKKAATIRCLSGRRQWLADDRADAAGAQTYLTARSRVGYFGAYLSATDGARLQLPRRHHIGSSPMMFAQQPQAARGDDPVGLGTQLAC